MRILHVSDTHLGAMPNGLLSRARDVYEAFKESIDIAIEERVQLYIHAGDFFDSPNPPPEAYIIAYRNLKRLKDRGIKVIIIAGQHDIPKRYASTPLFLLSDVGVIDVLAVDKPIHTSINIDGSELGIVGVPYSSRNNIPRIKPLKKPSILVAHLLLKEIGIPSEEADISINDFPEGFSYIALGDYHIKSVYRHSSGTPIVYPGATEVFKVNECCDKYVAIADINSRNVDINFIKIQSVRPWIIIECRDLNTFSERLQQLIKELSVKSNKKPPIVIVNAYNVKVELIAKILDGLELKRAIEYYRIRAEGGDKEIEMHIPSSENQYNYDIVSIDVVLKKIIQDDKLVELLSNFIKNPNRNTMALVVSYLRENPEVVKKLEKLYTRSIESFASNIDVNLRKDSDRGIEVKNATGRKGILSYIG